MNRITRKFYTPVNWVLRKFNKSFQYDDLPMYTSGDALEKFSVGLHLDHASLWPFVHLEVDMPHFTDWERIDIGISRSLIKTSKNVNLELVKSGEGENARITVEYYSNKRFHRLLSSGPVKYRITGSYLDDEMQSKNVTLLKGYLYDPYDKLTRLEWFSITTIAVLMGQFFKL